MLSFRFPGEYDWFTTDSIDVLQDHWAPRLTVCRFDETARPNCTLADGLLGENQVNMKTRHEKKTSGFTVIELMIVLMIVAILAALAYPSYTQYIRKARRGEAQQLLLNWSINQEIWRSNNPAYADENDIAVPNHDDYTFTVSNETATTYTLQALAGNDQVNDKARDGTYCGKTGVELQLLHTGVKSPASCWD